MKPRVSLDEVFKRGFIAPTSPRSERLVYRSQVFFGTARRSKTCRFYFQCAANLKLIVQRGMIQALQ
ncbi:hypothetical protein B597_017630 [Stutzerimonas stutzeri KOS6]|uniref:Uncharacterized protein n=1 Tax=Stutzerimonas stutzeri KOS6 TaxID=1218352 RepID=A0A061JP30_STUST|nr:hypothetical protein B597_017630 [Stutzerimonas stutzeri KOS6]